MLSIQYNLSYGIWTYLNLSKIISMQANSPVRCQLSTNMTDLNYAVVVIFGMFPALTLTSIVLLALLCSPCVIYTVVKNRREQMRQQMTTKEVIEKLLRFKYEPSVFKN